MNGARLRGHSSNTKNYVIFTSEWTMKVILKNEYLHPDWDAMGLQPLVCERPYVEHYAANDSGGVTLVEVGPFAGCSEAHDWIKNIGYKRDAAEHPHLKGEQC